MTRRDLAAAVTAAAALSQSRATAQEAPKPEPDLVAEARTQIGRSTQTLKNFKMDIAVEPAFQFKA